MTQTSSTAESGFYAPSRVVKLNRNATKSSRPFNVRGRGPKWGLESTDPPIGFVQTMDTISSIELSGNVL